LLPSRSKGPIKTKENNTQLAKQEKEHRKKNTWVAKQHLSSFGPDMVHLQPIAVVCAVLVL
jgi:hypothetical protein